MIYFLPSFRLFATGGKALVMAGGIFPPRFCHPSIPDDFPGSSDSCTIANKILFILRIWNPLSKPPLGGA